MNLSMHTDVQKNSTVWSLELTGMDMVDLPPSAISALTRELANAGSISDRLRVLSVMARMIEQQEKVNEADRPASG